MDVTIKDVASKAGVAVSTVSRVLNNLDRVSPETREKVNRAVEELGFVRNNFAASIKTGNTRFIAVIVPDVSNEFYTNVIKGVEKSSREADYYTIVYTSHEEDSEGLQIFDEKFGKVVDGIILVPSLAVGSRSFSMKKPMVIVDRMFPGYEGYSVTLNNYQGMCMLTQELIDNGHRKIALISNDGKLNVCVDRLQGFLDTMEKNGIEIPYDYVCMGSFHQEDGYRLTKGLMEGGNPPSAIIAGNNQLCIGSVAYCLENGIQIGKDISLVEFDDVSIAKYLGPGITGVYHSPTDMGKRAVEKLIRLINGTENTITEKKTVLDVELIRRKSVALL